MFHLNFQNPVEVKRLVNIDSKNFLFTTLTVCLSVATVLLGVLALFILRRRHLARLKDYTDDTVLYKDKPKFNWKEKLAHLFSRKNPSKEVSSGLSAQDYEVNIIKKGNFTNF